MATKSFLNSFDRDRLIEVLVPPANRPDGNVDRFEDFASLRVSQWLSERLLARLSSHPDWLAAAPIALGSWSRGELCPKSDIDILFCGDETSVARVVGDFSKEGLKLRYRMPEDRSDWTAGVQPFDVLALLSAVPLTEEARRQLTGQNEILRTQWRPTRKKLLEAMTAERKARAERFDSISNYLEPNLKYGPGGLRDLEQALSVRLLFPERFAGANAGGQGSGWDQHAFSVLRYYKMFFILVRQKLHLSDGGGDNLSAPEQKLISDWLGFSDQKEFMREIQKGLSRVSFYADWVIARATRGPRTLAQVDTHSLNHPDDLFAALESDPSVLMQNRVRRLAGQVFSNSKKTAAFERRLGRELSRFLDPTQSLDEAPMVALFRSRLIDQCVPEFSRIVGHVQHDQYHRFTVDAHILQALRELRRLYRRPALAGRLQKLVLGLTKKEWQVLAFSCLYHDIAKGRQGDHSIEGIEIARRDLQRFGKDENLIREVLWVVEEHLALSAAAFRENPLSPQTWRSLAEKGVVGRRIALLTIFTIVDIRATNPEAWTPWKERLLHELVTQLERPEADSLIQFSQALSKAKLNEKWLESLDPYLIGSVPHRQLVKDLQTLVGHHRSDELDLSPAVVQIKRGRQTWIRFHSARDRAGLFMKYVGLLASSGLAIRHASIHTDSELGVYDWFEVKTTRSPAQIRKILEMSARATDASSAQIPKVSFDSIEGIASDAREWVISFRGRDQSGALLAAARALFEEGASIRWAKVHTWGRQIDDVIAIAPLARSGESVKDLVARLLLRLNSRS